ncbi:VOC family protein [Phytoactinopolyspora halotolerans]|uniref:Glyoxalase n=1 Tax=Phytoactinopolyspora halotolerans TaxID=1981512 RepID=A0A6L9SCZ3_9ACTN|nr:VOC family protein [Phytoactinopolyspora halotolerans]NEE02411.1 glyoxalase [Phytoactinopolyspora halotolerans]
MGHAVVHFEIVGSDPPALRRYYADLFGWEYDLGDAATTDISAPGQYGFVDGSTTGDGTGINGGVCGGDGHRPRVLFYVGVPDVEAALQQAEALGGRRVMGPVRSADGPLVVGHITDPEGNLIGVAGTA